MSDIEDDDYLDECVGAELEIEGWTEYYIQLEKEEEEQKERLRNDNDDKSRIKR